MPFELVDRFGAEVIDDIVDEPFCRDALDADFSVPFFRLVRNSVEEVCFSEADPAVDEEGVV